MDFYYLKLTFLILTISFSRIAFGQQEADHRLPFIEAEIYSIDRSHSNLEFSIGFLGLTDVKGTFDDYSATILYNEEEMSKTAVVLRIDVTSVDTGNDTRDEDLKSERFFDAENYPEIVFESTRIEKVSGENYLVTGELRMKGVTKEISIPVQHVLKRTEDSAWGNVRIGFSGQTSLNRLDYNVQGGDFWGLKALSEEVQVNFTLLGNIFNLDRIAWGSREKPSIGEEMEKIIEEDGVDAALDFYAGEKAENPDSYNFSARELYLLASKSKQDGAVADALRLCEIYREAYPESAAAHTLQGELLAMSEDRDGAIASFKRVLELEPEDDLALMVLERLENMD